LQQTSETPTPINHRPGSKFACL